ncbi:DUF6894 family protein [Bradyrhizobium sp. U531]|uniref:DUF6894 family protein n=1 Tax=Bradyrhizobium sp. U531 TaxID=3053458 RepID=UPI003F685298
MPRYFLHVQGAQSFQDGDGPTLANGAAALNEAKRFARDIEPGATWRLEVHRKSRPLYFYKVNSGVLGRQAHRP